jgi:predicted ArsR family transcriptional regulator
LFSKYSLYGIFFKKSVIVPIIGVMTGMTIAEMAERLDIPRDTVKHRILRGGFKPITKDAIYTEEVFEAIRNVPGKGRPKKDKKDSGGSLTK